MLNCADLLHLLCFHGLLESIGRRGKNTANIVVTRCAFPKKTCHNESCESFFSPFPTPAVCFASNMQLINLGGGETITLRPFLPFSNRSFSI